MNRDRRIMDESRINSIIYRIGACLIVSSLFMSAVNATAKPISGTFSEGGGRVRRGISAGNLMVGQREKCNNEGEEVPTPKDFKCFNCICRNGFVECEPEQCPSVDECYYLEKMKDGCCRRCKACHYNGTSYLSGVEWTDPDDPCLAFKCLAGVVTQVNLQCYTSCTAISPPTLDSGQCCPTCLGCKYNGQTVLEGREVTSSEDPCLKCQCKNRRLECIKKACPVLHCPLSKQKKVKGECCPRCSEQRDEAFTIPGKCILGKKLHNNGDKFNYDCASCVCLNGTLHCKRNTCPVLECPMELQIAPEPGACCRKCPEVEELTSVCVFNKTTYQHDETWDMDSCRSCRCVNGRPNCAEMKCPDMQCGPNEMKKAIPGQCCPKCVESAGICTVFGDPHYKTFDGKFFSFQGMCKYQLAADCTGHTFSIRVTNDGRNTLSSSWTKTVTIKVNNLKINLGQKLRVKVNGTRVDLPFVMYSARTLLHPSASGNSITSLISASAAAKGDFSALVPEVEIRMTEEGVNVVTSLGVQLLWDGTNFLQVQAAATYKNQLCGLCGNYNGLSRDDFKNRNGVNLNESTVWEFADSWRVGGIKQCSKRFDPDYGREMVCKYRSKAAKCRPLEGNDMLFGSCKDRVNPSNYFKSCKKDMCECESNLCFCDSFTAYAHECERSGVVLHDWRRQTGCTLQAMRNGALIMPTRRKGVRGNQRRPKKPGPMAKRKRVKDILEETIPPELAMEAEKERLKRARLQRIAHRRQGRQRSNKLVAAAAGAVAPSGIKLSEREPLPLME